LDVVVAITHNLILGKSWLLENDPRINWIDHFIFFFQETSPPECGNLNCVTLSPELTKSFFQKIATDHSPCDLLIINLTRSADSTDIVMAFPEVSPLALPQTLPPSRLLNQKIELIRMSKLFSALLIDYRDMKPRICK